MLARRRHHRLGGICCRCKRGGHVHDEGGVAPGVIEQDFESRRVSRRVGVAYDVDGVRARPYHIGGSAASSRRMVSGVSEASVPPRSASRSTASTPDPAAVGQDGEPPARKRLQASERFSGGEQLFDIAHAQEAGPAEGRIVDRIRSGKRTSVGLRGFCTLSVAAGLDDDDRLRPRRRAGTRHELARIARVARSSAKKSRRSLTSTSTMSPSEAIAEKPTSRRFAHSTIPATMAPDCEINARSPGCGMLAAKLALSLTRGASTPRQFGPMSRRPLGRAALT
jgi:hypothetical protein